MVDSVEQLEVSDAVTTNAELPTVEPVVETVASIDIPSVEAIEQVNAPSVETEPPTEPEPVKTAVSGEKVLAGIAFVALLIWAIRQLMPTKQPAEPETEQGKPSMQGEIENQPDMDDWGDFSAVISGLEQTEVSELTDLPTEAANDDSKPAGEMFQGALSVLFTIAEQATTIISGVDFEFDEKAKRR